MSPEAENVLAAGAGALVVMLVFKAVATTTVRQQIVNGIFEIDTSTAESGRAARRRLPRAAQDAVDAEVERILSSQHLTGDDVRRLTAQIRAASQFYYTLHRSLT